MKAITPAVYKLYKRAQGTILQNEGKYQKLIQYAPTGILELDFKNGRFLSVNDVVCSTTGYSRKELLAMDPREFLDAADQDTFAGRMSQWLKGKEPEPGVDYRVKTKEGKEIYVALNVSFIRNKNGLPVRLMVLAHDITERKKMEDALRISEEKYHGLFNSLEEGFCVIEVLFDESGLVCDWRHIETNPAFEKHSGLTGVQGKLISDLMPDMDRSWFEFFGRVARTGIPARAEQQFKAFERWFEMHAFKIGGAESRKVAVIFYDITGRKRRDRQIRELIKKLHQSDRNKNEFLNMLSHELRNPLAAVTAAVDLLDMHDTDSFEKAKKIIKHQTCHLSRLVDELLDLTRITHNKILLKTEETDLNALARDISQDYQPAFEKSGIAFETQVEPVPLKLSADPIRVTQMIGNLLSNALKFTPEGGKVSLSVRIENTEAQISVKDNGIGIEHEFLPKIFEPFIQAGNSAVKSMGGLGLGLSIAKRIATLHGGDITGKSGGPGEGSEFTIHLPVKNAAKEAALMYAEEKNVRALKILLIEDNRDFSEILCAMLHMLGHETRQVFNGQDGIDEALKMYPDAILCDIGLPDMDGLAVAKAIRSSGGIKNIPLIALTGYAGTDDLKRAIEAGFDRHVAKPLNLCMLKEILGWLTKS